MKRKSQNRYSILLWLFLVLCILPTGCSRRKVPAPPKVQPELLLEIYDAARKNQYDAALQKIRKLRALDSTNIFLAELENTILYNQMTSVVDLFMTQNNYNGALNALQHYEEKNGVTKSTIQVRERLTGLLRLDRLFEEIQECRTADRLEYYLEELQKESKKSQFSLKIRNFLIEKQSLVRKMRYQEKESVIAVILAEAENCLISGDLSTGEVLLASAAIESPENPEILSLFSALTKVRSE